MIDRAAYLQLPPAQRAQLLYDQARADMSAGLWDAAIGNVDGEAAAPRQAQASAPGRMTLASMLALLTRLEGITMQPQQAPLDAPRPEERGGGQAWRERQGDHGEAEAAAGLGPNMIYRAALSGAAARTGIPAEALAAIVNAEAARDGDGSWRSFSRNPRSSAAGIGQFLSGTWKGEAERAGSWLNAYAQAQGWLNDHGHVRADAKANLLALRYHPRASIEVVADYARVNLARMREAGVVMGSDVGEMARAAYFAHHLGVGDAVRFLKRGLDPHRAAHLLAAQIGRDAANQRIAAAGDAASAHRDWLMTYVARRIRPASFAPSFAA